MLDADGGPIMTAGGEHSGARRPSVFHRWREGIARYRALHITWQITVLTIGFAIICAGIAMLVLPGPGWAAIFVGLAVLSTEFMWHSGCLPGPSGTPGERPSVRSTLDTAAATRRFSRWSSSSR